MPLKREARCTKHPPPVLSAIDSDSSASSSSLTGLEKALHEDGILPLGLEALKHNHLDVLAVVRGARAARVRILCDRAW